MQKAKAIPAFHAKVKKGKAKPSPVFHGNTRIRKMKPKLAFRAKVKVWKVTSGLAFHGKVKVRKVPPIQAICFQEVKIPPVSMAKVAKMPPGSKLKIWKVKPSPVFHGKSPPVTMAMQKIWKVKVRKGEAKPMPWLRLLAFHGRVKVRKMTPHHAPLKASSMQA